MDYKTKTEIKIFADLNLRMEIEIHKQHQISGWRKWSYTRKVLNNNQADPNAILHAHVMKLEKHFCKNLKHGIRYLIWYIAKELQNNY